MGEKNKIANIDTSKENLDIKYEMIQYDSFIGSQEFDFDKTIYDCDSGTF